MGSSPGVAALDRETFAAPVAAALEDRPAAPGAHPLAETVNLLPAAVMRLKCALHLGMPRTLRGWIPRVCASHGVYPTRPHAVKRRPRAVRAAKNARWIGRGGRRAGRVAKNFVARSEPPDVKCAPRQTPAASPSIASRACRDLSPSALARAVHPRRRMWLMNVSTRYMNSGRNGLTRSPLRPDCFVDNCGDNAWRGCGFLGTTQ
jgi:hypothetical protein